MTAAHAQSVLLGGGGHARVVLAAWHEPVFGVIAPHAPAFGMPKWLGSDDALADLSRDYVLLNGVGAIPLRRKLYDCARALGFDVSGVIHPSAILAAPPDLGPGVQIMARAVIQPNVSLGENTIINTGSIVEHDCQIGAHSHIAPGAILCGGVHVGAGSHLGAGAVIREGIRIGDNAVIGAGAVVVKDVSSGSKVMGCPAR
ncbi:MAG: acetyltransferase [Pelagimonas sp.]|jgi:UDP-perosamine 4-acetyltransferase|nr:acetyltransferase [Pelagimonas sp.]